MIPISCQCLCVWLALVGAMSFAEPYFSTLRASGKGTISSSQVFPAIWTARRRVFPGLDQMLFQA
jgi:hypothetical protein